MWAPYRVIEDVGNSSSRMSRAAAALRCSRKKILLASSVVGAACATRGRGRGVSGVRSACCVRTGRSPKCRAGGRVRRGRAGGRQQADGARRARLVANVRNDMSLLLHCTAEVGAIGILVQPLLSIRRGVVAKLENHGIEAITLDSSTSARVCNLLQSGRCVSGGGGGGEPQRRARRAYTPRSTSRSEKSQPGPFSMLKYLFPKLVRYVQFGGQTVPAFPCQTGREFTGGSLCAI